MAFYNDTGFGNTMGGDSSLSNISNLSNMQAAQAPFYGQQAAQYADPFMGERGFYQNQLKNVVSNPGSITSSPFYQFSYDQGLNALQRKGNVRSGNKLAELMRYGQGVAGQAYGQQVGLLTPLAMGGSSPGTAGMAYARGTERGQDYQQLSASARGAAQAPASSQQPWWAQTPSAPSGGALPYSSGGMDPYAALNAYNQQTATNVNNIYSGKNDAYLAQQYGIGQPSTPSAGFGQYDPFSDPYWGGGSSGVYGGDPSQGYDFGADYGSDY